MTSDQIQDFLTVRGRFRTARTVPVPLAARPVAAFLKDGYLTWTWDDSKNIEQLNALCERLKKNLKITVKRVIPLEPRKCPGTLCFDFARLAEGSDENIRRFAAKWGPLNFAKRAEEHIGVWRQYTRLALALLRFAADQLSGGPGLPDDWRTICESISNSSLTRIGMPRSFQMAIVAASINTWFAHAGGHSIVGVTKDGNIQVQPQANKLFGILITQIAHVIARSDQTVVCAGCKGPFPPKRRLVRGIRQYCELCRKRRIPACHAARDWRRRKRTSQ